MTSIVVVVHVVGGGCWCGLWMIVSHQKGGRGDL